MTLIRSISQTVRLRFSATNRLFSFLWKNKMWWMIPMVVVLVVGFVLIILVQSSPVGPFIYTLF